MNQVKRLTILKYFKKAYANLKTIRNAIKSRRMVKQIKISGNVYANKLKFFFLISLTFQETYAVQFNLNGLL